jgi:hypothetical protein
VRGEAAWERRRLRGRGHVRDGVVIGPRLRRRWSARWSHLPAHGFFDSRDRRGGRQDETFVAPKKMSTF